MFRHVSFIMIEPSHPGNVGAAARALKTMGFMRLVLVKPRFDDVLTHPEAIAFASGAVDILAQTQIVPTLEEALAPINLAIGLTARPRELGPKVLDIREAAGVAVNSLSQNEQAQVAILLGTERIGLTNEQLARCHYAAFISANPEYSSLNVAQALQLTAYELRYRLASHAELTPSTPATTPATLAAVDALMQHLEQSLIHIEYLDPKHPKRLMPRLRQLLTRAQLQREEVDLLRGICTAILKMVKK